MIATQPRPAAQSAPPLVSVIIPVYQGEAFVEGAVRSALAQTHRALEVFVVDDGSTDATLARLARIDDDRLRVLRQPNAGTAAARNNALAHARGAYIAFLDCDDRWFPDKIATELAVLQRAGEPAIAYGAHYAVDDRGALLHAAPLRRHSGPAFDLMIDGEDFLMPSLCMFDRRIFDAIGTFDESRYHEDHDLILRATRRFPIYPTVRRQTVYRQTTGGKARKILADYDAALAAEMALLREFGPSLAPREAERLRENVVRSLYLRFLMYGYGAHARRLRREVGFARFPGGMKGRLGRLFAATGINLIAPARRTVQFVHRVARRDWWNGTLARAGVELHYG
jgi:glycosyltransferase involved in cell wall biosynthesis